MRFFSLSVLALLPLVASHFTLDYPTSRGFDEDIEDQAPCGGFPNVGSRSNWNYEEGKVQIDSHHDTATVNVYAAYTNEANASTLTLADFTGGIQLQNALNIVGQGEFCFTKNLSMDGRVGQEATIMVEHISVHGRLYQCTDVVFSNDTSLGSNITCTNALTVAGASTSDDKDGAQDLFVGVTGVALMGLGSVAALLL